MKTYKKIEDKVEEVFNAMDSIEKVKVPPFFKGKTMQRLFIEEKTEEVLGLWFTPKWQLALLVVIITLNIFALSTANTSSYEDNVDYFAQTYNLKTNSQDYIFN